MYCRASGIYSSLVLALGKPLDPESWDAIQADFDSKIIPGMTHWQNPNFFAFYPANSSFEGILGDMYGGMLNTIGFNVGYDTQTFLICDLYYDPWIFQLTPVFPSQWICSPAATELETIILDWMAKMINLPEQFMSHGHGGGVIQPTASEAVIVVMVAARDRVLGKLRLENAGDEEVARVASKLIAYGSDQVSGLWAVWCKNIG